LRKYRKKYLKSKYFDEKIFYDLLLALAFGPWLLALSLKDK